MLVESEVNTSELLTAFATLETTSNRQEILACVARDDRIKLVECPHDGGACRSVPRFELIVRAGASATPVSACRSFLSQLTDAADRGMLMEFRILRGSELLQRHARSRQAESAAMALWIVLDESARASQPGV